MNILPPLLESYSVLKIKKEKLKTGSITFAFKTFLFSNVPIFSWFEIEYRSQVTSDKEKKAIQKNIKTLNLGWDLQSIILITISTFFIISYLIYFFAPFLDLVYGSIESQNLYSQIVTNIFELFLTDYINTQLFIKPLFMWADSSTNPFSIL